MSKLVVLNLGKGDLKQGFPTVTVQLWEDSNSIPIQLTGSLPAAPELRQLYRRWQLLYNLLSEAFYRGVWRQQQTNISQDIEIDQEDVTNVSSIEFGNLCEEFQNQINCWFKSQSFLHIDQKLRTKLAADDEIKVIFETENDSVRRIPWHLWNFFDDYHKSVVCLSNPQFERIKSLRKAPNIRILAILGNSQGIDLQKDRAILEQLPGAQTVFLVEPQRRDLDRWLWDKQGWDIIFFAGHSSSQGDNETGRIYINKTDSLTIGQLKNGLVAAVARGLSLAIFNSCDGLGLARDLASVHIPQMIVMREGVPDVVAQEFLKHFLEAFATGESFYLAVREAQSKLQGLEDEFPCASWLPVICQNPAAATLVWRNKFFAPSPILPSRRILSLVLKASLLITGLVIGARSLSMLQSSELVAFDLMIRLRPPEAPDPRILLVTVTEADVQAQPAEERKGASLSERSLATLVEKLSSFQPRVIALDIYRENPVSADFGNLVKVMQKSDRFIAICKASEDDKNPGVPPPPEVPEQRLGFSDVIPDPDNVIRRQLLAMAPASGCSTDKSFSFRIATTYLADFGIKPKLTKEKDWLIGNIVFKNLDLNSGGYQDIDNLGHQVLLNWRSSDLVATQITLKDVLNNQLTDELVRNRIVIIGTSAESFHDYWSTPYTAGGWPNVQMPGVVVQAHMVSQILSAVLDNRPLLWVLPKHYEVLWVWCWSLIGGIIAWRFGSRLRLGLALGGSVGVLYGICFCLLTQGGWVPVVPSALVLVASGGTVAAYSALKRE